MMFGGSNGNATDLKLSLKSTIAVAEIVDGQDQGEGMNPILKLLSKQMQEHPALEDEKKIVGLVNSIDDEVI